MKKLNIFIPPAMTNADRIRNMTDEQIAKFIMDIADAVNTEYCGNKPECRETLANGGDITGEDCVACMVRWLQQTAEVDHGKE